MESKKKKKKKIKWIEYDELQSYTLDCGLDLGLGCRMQMRWCGWVHVGHVIGFFFLLLVYILFLLKRWCSFV